MTEVAASCSEAMAQVISESGRSYLRETRRKKDALLADIALLDAQLLQARKNADILLTNAMKIYSLPYVTYLVIHGSSAVFVNLTFVSG